MKNENKTTGVLILIFSGKNTFWNQRKSLKNNSAKFFVSLRQVNHILRPSFYIEKGYKKEILGSWRMKIQNIANKNLLFWLLHTCTWEVTNKEQTCVLFVNETFNYSLFSRVLRVKSSMPIRFLQSFWLVDMWKYATKQELLHIKKWETYENEIA